MTYEDFFDVTEVAEKFKKSREDTACLYAPIKSRLMHLARAKGISMIKLHNNIINAFLTENKDAIARDIMKAAVENWED